MTEMLLSSLRQWLENQAPCSGPAIKIPGNGTSQSWILLQAHASLDQIGYCVIDNCSKEIKKNLLEQLGEAMPQHSGCLEEKIKLITSLKNVYGAVSASTLLPHTEYYESESIPPRWLVNDILSSAHCGGGRLILADMYPFLKELPRKVRNELSQSKCRFFSAQSVSLLGYGEQAFHPVLSICKDGAIFRYNFTGIEFYNEIVKELNSSIANYFMKNAINTNGSTGSLIIWDNHRFLHARTPFLDISRVVHRVWIRAQSSSMPMLRDNSG